VPHVVSSEIDDTHLLQQGALSTFYVVSSSDLLEPWKKNLSSVCATVTYNGSRPAWPVVTKSIE